MLRFQYRKYRDVANFAYLYFDKKMFPVKRFGFRLVFLYQIVDKLSFCSQDIQVVGSVDIYKYIYTYIHIYIHIILV